MRRHLSQLAKLTASSLVALCSIAWLAAAPPSAWLYQLQDADPAKIAAAGFSHAIIDYSSDGTDSTAYTRRQILSLADSGVIAAAYLSVGEAEQYRFYWNSAWLHRPGGRLLSGAAPRWLGRANRRWPGHFKVRYWDPKWREYYLRPYLDRILAANFRGVYLDIVEDFEYWSNPRTYGRGRETYKSADPRGDEPAAARAMIDLIRWIAEYTRTRSPYGNDFLVIPQNGERLIDYDSSGELARTVSGWASEDLWSDGLWPNPQFEIDERTSRLKRLQSLGKFIIAVDYVDDPNDRSGGNDARRRIFITRARAHGFHYYAARSDRRLDKINIVPGLQP